MKCDHCGKNEVTFVYQSNVNGKVTEAHLCGECAEKLGYTRQAAARSRSLMQDFFGGGLWDSFFSPGLPALMGRMLEDPFDDFFTEMPALGAPARQQPAKTELVQEEEQNRFSRMRQRNALKMELNKAIRQEEFERAAELRDQIRALDAEHSDGETASE